MNKSGGAGLNLSHTVDMIPKFYLKLFLAHSKPLCCCIKCRFCFTRNKFVLSILHTLSSQCLRLAAKVSLKAA